MSRPDRRGNNVRNSPRRGFATLYDISEALEYDHVCRNPKLNEPTVELLDTIGLPFGGQDNMEFSNPSGFACDPAGNLVVADTGNHRIVKIDGDGNLLWSLGARDDRGAPRPGTAQGEFSSPQAVCTDSEANIYVADSRNCRVQKLSPDGEPITALGSWGND